MTSDGLRLLPAVMERQPRGLITDFDGTISELAAVPDQARISPRCLAALKALVGRLDLVAVVSGRPADVAAAMVGLDNVVYVGNHGLERVVGGQRVFDPKAAPFRRAVAGALREIRASIALPGIVFEDKDIVAAVHYRNNPQPLEARKGILAVVREIASAWGLGIAEGKRVVEIRPPVPIDKGTAVASLVAEAGLRGVVYLGDDATDAAAFRRLRQLRRARRCASVCFLVDGPESASELGRLADAVVEGVTSVAALLEWLGESL